MTRRRSETVYISIRTATERSGLSRRVVQECVERRLVAEPLTDADLAELRRIRRLQELGINLPGIEAILHMRQRLAELRAELVRRQQGADRLVWFEAQEAWRRLLPQELDRGREGE